MLPGRYLVPDILEFLAEKMVFIGGPRQVGKTTIAHALSATFSKNVYLNWDNPLDKKHILRADWSRDTELVILDEIHKYQRWKSHVKGLYDSYKNDHKFIITGSARLDIYRKGGDSMLGRYHYVRLHPFSVAELAGARNTFEPFKEIQIATKSDRQTYETLYAFGGFPQPFLKATNRYHRIWLAERLERIFREDIRDLENVRDISLLQAMQTLLIPRVASLLSINSLREDLQVSHKAVSHWLDIVEMLYYIYRVRPYSEKLARTLKQEAKLFLWDWSEVEDASARFENMVGSHLLKFAHFMRDSEGYQTDLQYLRDKEKREVDFLLTVKGRPWFAAECKLNEETISPHLKYFGDRLKIPFLYQVVSKPGIYRRDKSGVILISADRFFASLV